MHTNARSGLGMTTLLIGMKERTILEATRASLLQRMSARPTKILRFRFLLSGEQKFDAAEQVTSDISSL